MPDELSSKSHWPGAKERSSRHRPGKWLIVASLSVVGLFALAVAALVHTDVHRSLPQAPIQPPVVATAAWFEALNTCNMPLINAHVVAAKRGGWTCIDPFTHVHCVPESQAAATATVRCTFDPQNDPRVGNTGDTFWSVYLELSSSGRWLVTDWGQP